LVAAANAQPVITFNAKTDFTTGDATPWTVPIGDLNSDGKPNLAVAKRSSNTVSVLLNATSPGASSLSLSAHIDFTTGSSPASVTIRDLNGDGKPDLVVANPESNDLKKLKPKERR